jgi:hypothetical protein
MVNLRFLRNGFHQGDQIGRIFAQWMIVYSESFMKITEVCSLHFGLFFLSEG